MSNPWKRVSLTYQSTQNCVLHGYGCVVIKRLDFLSYHLIKWIHGEKKLIEMAEAPPRTR